MSDIFEITKETSKFLKHVFNYMNRSIGVCFVSNTQEIEELWEAAQYELSASYQYEGVNEHVWDYYLVYCCDFNEEDLDERIRFKVESDRFCCRKFFVFDLAERNFSKEKLIEKLFPVIKSSKPIQILSAKVILDNFGDELKELVPESFFTEELDEANAKSLLDELISKVGGSDDK